MDASPQLTAEDRQVLEAAVSGRRDGGCRSSRQRAQEIGLRPAGYRLERAYARLGLWEPRPRRRVSGALRRELIALAIAERAACGLCGHAIITENGLALDHIERRRDGGSDDRANLLASTGSATLGASSAPPIRHSRKCSSGCTSVRCTARRTESAWSRIPSSSTATKPSCRPAGNGVGSAAE